MSNKTVRLEELQDIPPIDLATDEYAPDPYAPRKDASKIAARARLEREGSGWPAAPAPARKTQSNALPIGVGAVLLIALLVVIGYQAQGTALRTSAPTEAPAHTFVAPPTSSPAPTLAPQPTSAPVFTPAPTALPVAAPGQIGRGLTIDPAGAAVATPTDVPEPPPAPSYIEVVGAQAPHTIRSGATGPCDKACSVVPTISAEQAAIIGAQVPHKVR